MAHIDYYLATISPNCYLAGTRPAEVAAKHGATIAYKPVNAGRLMSETGGLPVPQRHPSRQAYRLQDLPRIAKRAGNDLCRRFRGPPTRPTSIHHEARDHPPLCPTIVFFFSN